MGFEPDEEILQDFLVEAGEILEQLSEQLVELEQNPEDKELLNAIFRGFHTVKGGAGFLQLDALVDCCHVSENVFDLLRNGALAVSTELMDVVLLALDAINEMFDQVKLRDEPTPADPSIISGLEAFVNGDAAGATTEADVDEETREPSSTASAEQSSAESEVKEDLSEKTADITDEEFETFLNALDDSAGAEQAKPEPSASKETGNDSVSADSDEITDDEFEALLDQLHGSGKFDASTVNAAKGVQAKDDKNGKEAKAAASSANTSSAKATADSDEISDDEFESLLDELHGKGKFGSETAQTASAGSTPKSSSQVAQKAEPKSPVDIATAAKVKRNVDQSAVASGSVTKANVTKANVTKANVAKASTVETKAAPAKTAGGPGTAVRAGGRDAQQSIATETTVRVDTRRLDDIMNMVGELVLVRNRLKRLGEEIATESMTKAVSNLDVVTSDLQSAVMQTRMQPIKKVFGRFPRVVRDLARSLKKEVNLVLRGEDTDLDKNLVEALSDPLVHLVRNAVDHGVENPDVREKNGKPRIGRVVLSAQQEGDHILLSIEDDGAGMDADVLREKAVEKGLYDADAAERLTDQEAYNLIFAAGFSTKTEISDVSGRGVGMDVVKTKITQLNGTLQVDSELGKGSMIIIKVPLTLAIMPTLMVMLDDQAFAFPLVSVVEIFHLDLTKTNIVDGQECIVVRENVYPVFHIKRWLLKGAEYQLANKSGHVVIVSVGTKRVGLVVDQLVGQEEVVIKPLGKMLTGTAGMAGATITGDGRIALILDIPTLLSNYSSSSKVYGRPLFRETDEIEQSSDEPESAAYGS